MMRLRHSSEKRPEHNAEETVRYFKSFGCLYLLVIKKIDPLLYLVA